jgi:chitinase
MGNGKLAADEGDGNLISEFPKLSHAAGCPAILGVLDLNKGTFHPQVINSEKRRKLIAKIVSWVKKYSYDGVDIDWEQPKVESDKKDFVVFSRELRAALPSPRYLLTFDMTRSPLWDLPSLAVIYDFIQFMAYDMHGGWSEHAGYNAPLYLDPRDKDGDWGDSLSVDLDTQWILKAGAPPGQLILGIPFYGHGFSVGLYEKGVNGNASYLPYEEIQRNWISKGWSRRWDKAAKVPYLVHPGEAGVVSYDDAESLQAKCRYALSKGLAGVMIYAVGYDREASGRQPLMDAVAEVLKARH